MKNDIIAFDIDGQQVYVEGEIPQDSGKFIADNGDKQIVSSLNSFEDALEPIILFSKNIIKKINNIEIDKPAEVEVQFGIKLTGAVSCWVISGQGEGSINLKLTWKSGK